MTSHQHQPLADNPFDDFQQFNGGMYELEDIRNGLNRSPTAEEMEILSASSSFHRGSRLTQSMFSKEQEAMDPFQDGLNAFEYNERRASLMRREQEITRVTAETLKHVEDVIEKTRQLQEKEAELSLMRAEVQDLQQEVERLKNLLHETQLQMEEKARYTEELQRQLLESRQKMAESRMTAEKYKVQNVILEDGTFGVSTALYKQLEQEFQETRDKLATSENRCAEVVELNVRLSRDVERLKERNDTLFTSLSVLQKDKRLLYIDEDEDETLWNPHEPRSRWELLAEIRRLMADKVAWQNYASGLILRIMNQAPSILCSTVISSENESPATEVAMKSMNPGTAGSTTNPVPGAAAWESYALHLTSHVLQHAPHILDSLSPTPSQTVQQPTASTSSNEVTIRIS